jgi:hypothetical protein
VSAVADEFKIVIGGVSLVAGLSLLGLGVLALLARSGQIQFFAFYLVELPAVLLALIGIGEPFIAGGGGLAWLAIPGILLVYLLPGGLLLFAGWLVRK